MASIAAFTNHAHLGLLSMRDDTREAAQSPGLEGEPNEAIAFSKSGCFRSEWKYRVWAQGSSKKGTFQSSEFQRRGGVRRVVVCVLASC
jgi:hypothetical protein